MEEAKLRLQQQLASTENKHSVMMDEVQTIDRHMCAKITENKVLQAKVQKLRKYLTVCPLLSRYMESMTEAECFFQ